MLEFGLTCIAGGLVAGTVLGIALSGMWDIWQDYSMSRPKDGPSDMMREINKNLVSK